MVVHITLECLSLDVFHESYILQDMHILKTAKIPRKWLTHVSAVVLAISQYPSCSQGYPKCASALLWC